MKKTTPWISEGVYNHAAQGASSILKVLLNSTDVCINQCLKIDTPHSLPVILDSYFALARSPKDVSDTLGSWISDVDQVCFAFFFGQASWQQ